MEDIRIRAARKEDCEQIACMIKELGAHLNCPNGPQLDADELRRDGFGEDKLFRCIVAENTKDGGSGLVGHALYYFVYSAWNGCCIHLDDLYVRPGYRGAGIGTALWREVAKDGVNKGCRRMDLWCLESNSSAIAFYKRRGGVDLTAEDGWCLFRLRKAELETFAASGSNGAVQ